jgi:hypothetical protein
MSGLQLHSFEKEERGDRSAGGRILEPKPKSGEADSKRGHES